MTKKVIKNIVFVILMAIMIIGFIYLGTKDYGDKPNVQKDNEIMARNFKMLGKDNVYKILKNNEAAKFINSGEGVILFCIKSSQWCNYYVSLVDEVAQDLGIDTINYFDITTDRENNTYYYQKIVTSIKDYLPKTDTGNYNLQVPDLYIVNNGVIISHNNETSSLIGPIEPQEYWTIEKQNEFKQSLREMLIEFTN